MMSLASGRRMYNYQMDGIFDSSLSDAERSERNWHSPNSRLMAGYWICKLCD